MRTRFSLYVLFILCLVAGPASAYEVWIDLDDDDDPNTLNLITEETTATVRLILAPSTPGEQIDLVGFGLGGSCRECEMVHHYGVVHDLLVPETVDWDERADMHSTWMGATRINCFDTPGFHLWLELTPVNTPYLLNEPIFIATFEASVAPTDPGCPRVPSNLATMFGLGAGQLWNYVQIGGPAIATEATSWGCWKSVYR